jgi:hypothetical protein
MPVRLDIEIVITPSPTMLATAFFASAERVRSLGSPMQQATEIYAHEIDLNFIQGGRPTPWEPLAASTVMKRGTDSPILIDTDVLHSEASSPSAWAVSGGGQNVLAELITQDAVYGLFHLTGTTLMPIRDWAYISDEALSEIDNIFADWVTGPMME